MCPSACESQDQVGFMNWDTEYQEYGVDTEMLIVMKGGRGTPTRLACYQ